MARTRIATVETTAGKAYVWQEGKRFGTSLPYGRFGETTEYAPTYAKSARDFAFETAGGFLARLHGYA